MTVWIIERSILRDINSNLWSEWEIYTPTCFDEDAAKGLVDYLSTHADSPDKIKFRVVSYTRD